MIVPGTVFQLCGTGNHIRIVLSQPRGTPPRVLACNLTDPANCADSPCVLERCDHEWITKKSVIPFHYLTDLPCGRFDTAESLKQIIVAESLLSPSKLAEIQNAIINSAAVSAHFKDFLR